MKRISAAVIVGLFWIGTAAFGTILNTKHNLSVTGTGDITATTEGRVCVFCHIPHSAQTGKHGAGDHRKRNDVFCGKLWHDADAGESERNEQPPQNW